MENKTTFTIALIALIISLSVPLTERTFGDVFTNELKDYYVCNIDKSIKEFPGRVSGARYSGYPYIDSRKGAIYCGTSDNKGEWMQIEIYAKSVGIDPYDLLQKGEELKKVPTTVGGKQWICHIGGCEPI